MLPTRTGRVPCRRSDLRRPGATRGSLKRRIFGANIAYIMSASGFFRLSRENYPARAPERGIFDVIEV
jgi:hypothetical protein